MVVSFSRAFLVSIATHALLAGVISAVVSLRGNELLDQSEALKRTLDVEVFKLAEKQRAPQPSQQQAFVAKQTAGKPVEKPQVAGIEQVPVVAQALAEPSVQISGEEQGELTLTLGEYVRWVRAHNSPPDYPRGARLRREQGKVVVQVVVAKRGSPVESAEIQASSGSAELDAKALETTKGWRFPPFSSASERISIRIPFVFALEDS